MPCSRSPDDAQLLPIRIFRAPGVGVQVHADPVMLPDLGAPVAEPCPVLVRHWRRRFALNRLSSTVAQPRTLGLPMRARQCFDGSS